MLYTLKSVVSVGSLLLAALGIYILPFLQHPFHSHHSLYTHLQMLSASV